MQAGAASPDRDISDRYSTTAIWLHWIIAGLIIANLALGLLQDEFGREARGWMIWLHKATGMTVLGLSLARLLWRLGHRPPPFDPALLRWEIGLARAVHWLFYLMMIAIPLSGWLLSSSGNRATDFFGLFEIPPLPISRAEDVNERLGDVHEILGKAMIGLILLHVAGAVRHHSAGHTHLIGRMGIRIGGTR
jgi:cytochrome b561